MSGIHAEEMGKDFTDMSKPFGTPFEQWSVVNGMLPPLPSTSAKQRVGAACRGDRGGGLSRARWSVQSTLYRRSSSQDYDQLLDKGKGDAVFAMHQDMAYWPPLSHGQRHAHRYADAGDRR